MRYGMMVALGALVAQGSSAAGAYEIRPKDGIHEAMTLLASECLAAAKGAEPRDCLVYGGRIPSLLSRRRPYSYSDLEEASRWPDDPTHQIRGASLLKFGFNARINCPRILRKNPEVGNAGLLCSSHHGTLQFMHAMQSSAGEDTAATRAKILDWARFAFSVATHRVDLNQSYCDYFRRNQTSISSAFAPSSFPFCKANGQTPGWRVSTLFSLKCGNPVSSRNCVEPNEFRDSNLARRNATGAVLHLIQDSFSQSHAARGDSGDPSFSSVVECRLPTAFYNYKRQTSSAHGRADQVPTFARSCGPGAEADDVITASAMALWHIRQRSDPALLISYLENRVFSPA